MRLNSFMLAENFNLIEFQCPCCHTVKLHPALLRRAVLLRLAWGRPVVINSGYRCEEHNSKVGGVKGSLHRQGRAIDVRVDGSAQEAFRQLALSCGFERVLLYGERNFAHMEI